jgi:hypothetical protein
MAIDINDFVRKYGLEYEIFQAGNRRIRLALANAEPPFEDSKEYNSITGNPLLCPLDSGEWALVTSRSTTRFSSNSGVDAVAHAKGILIEDE